LAGNFFSPGRVAAGLSSAVTAPLAAAITARSLFGSEERPERWSDRSWRYRAVWGGVLGVGLLFGLSGIQPIPVIVLAQALNGLLLPIAAVFLLLSVNDRQLMGGAVNGPLSNVMMSLVTAVSVVLGTIAVVRAMARAVGQPAPEPSGLVLIAVAVAVVVAIPVGAAVARRRSRA
jgi:Mn2+/Fe2+ NRAMP family transporter